MAVSSQSRGKHSVEYSYDNVIRIVVRPWGGRIWMFQVSMCVNDMGKGAIYELA
jgi:hypothetical protein